VYLPPQRAPQLSIKIDKVHLLASYEGKTVNGKLACEGTYMVLILQLRRLDLLELLRQGRHDERTDQRAVEKSFREV
jgi:hypothetical protein